MSIELQNRLYWEGSLFGILCKHLFVHPKPVPSNVSLSGRTAIVTGSNSGIGFEASRQLLQLGVGHLVMGVRSQARGDAAAAELRAQFPCARVDVSILDMADYDSVVAFVRRCREDLEHIDHAILNAGQQNECFRRSEKTGHEMVLQVNYLSTSLLAFLLVALMREKRRPQAGSPPVLSIVGSDTMWLSSMSVTSPVFPRLDDPKAFAGFRQYSGSKLLIMMFVYQLKRNFSPDEILINVCNPGLVGDTGLGASGQPRSVVTRFFAWLFHTLFARTAEAGASNYIYAQAVVGPRSHGSFVSDWDIKP
ncbi:hypothetical protein Daus18300_010506 [Diaporthe australafricana]|uniref:Uncharacterized protein n=1 Tax=Diaporthe australafricana TaxID=127596 RepID=A0ABR3WA65_9PEZI